MAAIFDWFPLYRCCLWVNNSIAENLVSFIHMLHLPNLTAENVKLWDDRDVWIFM